MKNNVIQLSLSSAAFFMDGSQDVDIDTALNVLTHEQGWHQGAHLNMEEEEIEDIVKQIDDLIIS